MTTPDAAPAADAPASGSATVIVLGENGAPVMGATVVFYAPGGEIAGSVPTGADGKATHEVQPGGSITAAAKDPSGGHRLVTFLEVKPGQTIVNDLGVSAAPPVAEGTASITLPGARDNASAYELSRCRPNGGIGSSNASAVVEAANALTVYAHCLESGKLAVYAAALDDTGAAIAFAFGETTLATTPSFMLSGWQPSVPASVTPGNVPAWADGISATIAIKTTAMALFTVFNGSWQRDSGFGAQGFAVPTGNLTGVMRLAAISQDGHAQAGALVDLPALSSGTTGDLSKIPPPIATFSASLAEPGRPSATWTIDVADDRFMTALGSFDWNGHVWLVVAPPTRRNFVVPKLPPALAEFWPADAPTGKASLMLFNFPGFSSYDDFLTTPSGHAPEGKLSEFSIYSP